MIHRAVLSGRLTDGRVVLGQELTLGIADEAATELRTHIVL